MPQKKKAPRDAQNTVLIGVLAAAILLLVVLVVIGIISKKSQKVVTTKCDLPLHSSSNYQYEEYSVESGDTLVSIAEKTLGDKTRVQELITLNLDTLPTLRTRPEYLETGWKLLLPPKDILLTKHDLAELRGHLHEVFPDHLVISTTKNLEQRTHLYITEDSQFKKANTNVQLSDLKQGDCISAVIRYQDSLPNVVLVLEVLD